MAGLLYHTTPLRRKLQSPRQSRWTYSLSPPAHYARPLVDASYLTRYATGWRASCSVVHWRQKPFKRMYRSGRLGRLGIMSLQYDQAPQLTYAQQEAVQRVYDARAKSSTTAFLLCYFLGIFGAHRMYLGQWGAAALRLLLPLIAVGLAILGVLDVLSFATFSLAVITLICALIWETVDLARIDRDVTAANTALMNR